jgi:hypothetical protein
VLSGFAAVVYPRGVAFLNELPCEMVEGTLNCHDAFAMCTFGFAMGSDLATIYGSQYDGTELQLAGQFRRFEK